MHTLDTYLRSDTYDELVLAMSDAHIGHLITGKRYQVTLIFPEGTEVLPLPGPIARTLYRTPGGLVFAWVNAYNGQNDVFQCSSQRAWDINISAQKAQSMNIAHLRGRS